MKEIHKEEYPEKLKSIREVPQKLYVLGDSTLLKQKAIAVVGSRNASIYGKSITKKFVQEMAKKKIVIASGLAIGIDEVAHRECMQVGGKTIAILGSGLQNIYPPENQKLAKAIIETGGLLLSEYEPEELASKKNFPKRNRILSALSEAVLVIEASHRSGSKITARYALEQGKKVYLIPPNLESKNITGVKELAIKGGKFIFTPQEMIEELKIENQIELRKITKTISEQKQIPMNLNKNEEEIYQEFLKEKSMNINQIVQKIKMPISEIGQTLTLLEIKGILKKGPGNNYELK